MVVRLILGERVDTNRAREALDTEADPVAAACPFCIVMLTDGVDAVTSPNSAGAAGEVAVEVTDIAEVLLRSCVGTATPEPVEGTTR